MVIDQDLISGNNTKHGPSHLADLSSLGEKLDRAGFNIEALIERVQHFSVAIPTWGVGTGGTRFGRFPGPGEPRNVFEKVDDCAVIQQLGRATATISPHFPWDRVDDYSELRDHAAASGLAFDVVNSNSFQDQPGQSLSYKFGSLTHTGPATRAQAVEHNLECIEIGQMLGSKALTVWIADGANFPGQQDLTRSFDRYIDSVSTIYAALPSDWQVFLEHKFYEPAFYSTVIADWGSSYLAAQALGPKAKCLVDLGHHAANANIEQIVARLIRFEKLAGFHFNDSKYGDDDLDAGTINPYQLFLVFHELVNAERRGMAGFEPAYMIDQSHNVTDPIESLITSSMAIQRAYTQALLVNWVKLESFQEQNDGLMARETLMDAYRIDVGPLTAEARRRSGGALRPLETYRASGYRAMTDAARPQAASYGGGIV